MFEDSSRNLNTHDAVDTGVGAPVSDGDGRGAHGVRPGERGVPARILGKDRSLGDRATQDDPLGGHRWHKQISTEIAKIRPDLLLLVYSLEDQEDLSGQAQTWLKSLFAYTKESLVLDSLGSLRWKSWFENSVEGSEREFLLFQCRGDLGIGTFS